MSVFDTWSQKFKALFFDSANFVPGLALFHHLCLKGKKSHKLSVCKIKREKKKRPVKSKRTNLHRIT